MIFSYLKKLNPTKSKKCLYLSNRMPIIYEMTSYLKSQTGLSIFYSNSRNSLKKNIDKFDEADVCMFRMEDFLKVLKLLHKKIKKIFKIIFSRKRKFQLNVSYSSKTFYASLLKSHRYLVKACRK